MLRKLSVFILMATSSCVVIYSQKTPEAPKQPKPSVWAFQFDGSYLGIEPQEVTKENFGKFGLSSVRGVAVEKVVENSPAAQAGIQSGDVIVKFEGEEITSVRKLTRLISEVAPDHQVKLTILRNGSEQEITATMGKFTTAELQQKELKKLYGLPGIPEYRNVPVPPQDLTTPFPTFDKDIQNLFLLRGNLRQIGISVMPLTKQLGEYFGIESGKGVLINNVRENSPAAKAGLKAGDIIVETDGKAVSNNSELIRTINEKKEGDVTLTIIRDRNRQTISVTPEKIKGEITPLFDGN